ncbi:uncharacterized protein LOC122575802 [Bombus pyrosoma]|uniref:uncharacterized protein LOC122575802 n=1 Tax=Bombus pyrosoma TaxID=396416 RepID=UPI001CB9422D|nr:uncharacterized protein LOC122575802 [Bombus pyrosoma]
MEFSYINDVAFPNKYNNRKKDLEIDQDHKWYLLAITGRCEREHETGCHLSCIRDASIYEDDYYLLTDRHLANSGCIVLRLRASLLLLYVRTQIILVSDKFKVELLPEHGEEALEVFKMLQDYYRRIIFYSTTLKLIFN